MSAAIVTLVLLTLAVGLVTGLLLLRIREGPRTREDRLFATSQDHDATVQQAIEAGEDGPHWLRLNLRDGRVLWACGESTPEAARYHLFLADFDAAASEAPPPDERQLLFTAERRRTAGRLSEEVALLSDGARVGSMLPTAERRLGFPWEWRIHLPGHAFLLRGRTLLADERPVGTLIPGPFPRIAYLMWPAEARPEERPVAGALFLLLTWTEWLLRRDRLAEVAQ